MSGDVIAMLISVTACLFLAARALSGHRSSFEKKAGMAVAWAVIIAVLTFAISRFGA